MKHVDIEVVEHLLELAWVALWDVLRLHESLSGHLKWASSR